MICSLFNSHFGRKLSKDEAEELERNIGKSACYKWLLPAFGKSTLKWIGTKEWSLEVLFC